MTGTMVATAALMGLAGSAHCAGMCGAACAGVGRTCTSARPARGVAALLVGRGLAYTAAGAAVGLFFEALQWVIDASGWMKPMWTLAQLMLIGLGVWLVVRGELPPSLQLMAERLGRPRPPAVQRVHLPGELKAGVAGLLWPLLPCGLLHAALGLAALSSSPVEAGTVMAAFASTSSVGLLVGDGLWRRIGVSRGNAGTLSVRMAGAGIALFTLWPLARHVWLPIQNAWCG